MHGAHAPQPHPPPTPARPAPAQALADSLDPLPAAPAAAPLAAAAAAAAPIASSDEEDRDWFAGRNADNEATEDESERMSFASLFGDDVDEEPEVVEESLKVGGNINTHLFVTSLSYGAEMGEIQLVLRQGGCCSRGCGRGRSSVGDGAGAAGAALWVMAVAAGPPRWFFVDELRMVLGGVSKVAVGKCAA